MECKNCFNIGHKYDQCRHPMTSYGIILIRINNGATEYLMCQRLYSLSLIEILKGRYIEDDTIFIQSLLSRLTSRELGIFINVKSFDQFIKDLFCESEYTSLTNDRYYHDNNKKFQLLLDTMRGVDLDDITPFTENEWGFSKGRRNTGEVPIETALREFYEETDIKIHESNILHRKPVEEIFTGTNGKMYRHLYYFAEVDFTVENKFFKNNSEIKQIHWFTKEKCAEKINCFYRERIDLIKKL